MLERLRTIERPRRHPFQRRQTYGATAELPSTSRERVPHLFVERPRRHSTREARVASWTNNDNNDNSLPIAQTTATAHPVTATPVGATPVIAPVASATAHHMPGFRHTSNTDRRLALVVNDNPQQVSPLIELLRYSYDYNVVTTDSTHSALTMLNYGLAQPDIVVSDMGRIEGEYMNYTAGMDLLEQLRAFCDVPLVVLTTPDNVLRYIEQVTRFPLTAIVDQHSPIFQVMDELLGARERERGRRHL